MLLGYVRFAEIEHVQVTWGVGTPMLLLASFNPLLLKSITLGAVDLSRLFLQQLVWYLDKAEYVTCSWLL
jgi:hypothetical protein